MAQDGITLRADKGLTDDLNKATNFQELQTLLHNAIERSPELGLTRDVNTGRFVARAKEPVADKAAADKAAAAPREFKQTVKISGRDFDFVASSAEALELQIASARSVADALTADDAVTPRSARHPAAQTPEETAIARSNAEIEFRQGRLTTTEYLEKTGAFDEYLADKGIDVDALGAKQQEQGWADAATEFLQSDAGASWPGGIRNRELLGTQITAMGLERTEDKVAALAAAFAELKRKNTLFEGDHSREQLEKMTDKATPQEILQAWKESVQPDVHGDATQANEVFIRNFGGSSIFGK